MLEPAFVIKNPMVEDSQNYALLREVGIVHIEKLAHRIWTDYNIHDPGITFMELLCYAITDLGYRTSYDMKDLLTETVDYIPVNTSNFHTAFHIFPCNPVTFIDLRKWLIDIDGVRHAWVSKNEEIAYCLDPVNKELKEECTDPQDISCPPLNGLFDVLLEYEDTVSRDERIAHLGMLENIVADGSFIDVEDKGILFAVRHALELKKVYLYVDAGDPNLGIADNLEIHLFRREPDASLTEIVSPTGPVLKTIELADTSERISVELNFLLEPGHTYLLNAQGSQVQLFHNDNIPFDNFFISQVVDLIGGFDDPSLEANYYFFYDWELTYSSSPTVNEQVLALPPMEGTAGLPDNTDPPTGSFETPGSQALRFRAFCALEILSVGVYPEIAGDVKIRLLDQADTVLFSVTKNLTDAGALNEVILNWSVEPGGYKLDANGSVVTLYQSTGVSYPYELDSACQILYGIDDTDQITFDEYFFFYHWNIRYKPCPVQISKLTKEDIQQEVRNRVHKVRNLCEDFIGIRDLKVEEIGVCADIEVRPDVDIEEVLAEMFFQLDQYVSPPVHFYTIEELKDRGKTVDQIFEGPLLDHGFIDDDEFKVLERRCFLRTSDIIQILMDVDGALAVKEISPLSFVEVTDAEIQPGDQIVVFDGKKYRVTEEPWILPLQDVNFFAPDFSPEKSKIIFYKNELPYFPNKTKVLELYHEKRAKNFNNKLKGHERDIPAPVGEDKDLEVYYPFQNELPATYRVGQYRVPKSNSKLRKAQSKQLKAYLLFFEQILANYLAQLSHIKELFSWERVPAKSYFTQKVETGIKDLESLYFDFLNLETDLEGIIETTEVAEERKNRFLDHLLGRFSENMTEYGLLMYNIQEDTAARVVTDKQCLLANYPDASALRGKSFDYRTPRDPDNLTGYQRRLYRLLGIHDGECKIFNRHLASDRFQLINNEVDDVDIWQIQLVDEEDSTLVLFETLPDESCNTQGQICSLLDNLIPFGADPEHWQLDTDLNQWILYQECDGEEKVFGIVDASILTMEDLQEKIIDHFIDFAQREGFHVIEHILLRKRSQSDHFMPVEIHADGEECHCVEVKDPYSFRATVILPSWPTRFQSTRFRQYVEKMLRLEAPAHVYLKICWISHCEMQEFEACYFPWQEAHAKVQASFKGVPDIPEGIQVDPLMDICPDSPADEQCYHQFLNPLIKKLHDLTTVYPVARLHDCSDESGDEPPVTLNNTNLGSL